VKRAAVVLLLVAAACGDAAESGEEPIVVAPATTLAIPLPSPPPPAAAELLGLGVERIGTFEEPTWVGSPPGDERIFVVEKRGVVSVLHAGQWHTYLNIAEFVDSDGPELGMVGLAFHPEFATNGRFFVYYTDRDRNSQVVEFSGATSLIEADPTAPVAILEVDQPQQWHNGGNLVFDGDGYLWLSLGDGGGIGDQYENAQDPSTLLGSLLRLDVNAGRPYAIPPDNPFIDGGGAAEVWAYGLRNPYRHSIDPVDRLVYIADVGQERWEEIDVVALAEPGHNFGWPITEGYQCYVDILLEPEPASVPCSKEGFTDPVATYEHGPACAIVGGSVYRGRDLPELYGHYVYGDWCAGFLRSLRIAADGSAVERVDWSAGFDVGRINSIGTDGEGELLLAGPEGVFRVVAQR
jgi:glucose/arabinose dehydrogenase